MHRSLALLALVALACARSGAEEDWFPSRFGAEDRIGAANYLSAEIVMEAAALVTRGQVYSLGVEVGPDTPAYPPRNYQIVITQSNDGTGPIVGENRMTANDDLIITYPGIGSQIDGFAHMGIGHRYYNGLRAQDFVTPSGVADLGTEKIPPIATRGVLLDMAALLGVPTVPEGTAYNRAEIEAAVARQKTPIRRGDVVIFHSGWHAVRESDPQRWLTVHPGPGVEGAEYLAELGVVAVGADSAALEVLPPENAKRPFEVHQVLLAKNGVYILENMWTGELVADGVHEFLFVLGQPKFKGAVQMTINPVAIR